MTEFECITEKNIQTWYELSWQDGPPPAIILRIDKNFIQNLDVKLEKSPIVKSFKKDFNFQKFSGDFGKDIGFEEVFKRIGENKGFVEFLIEIPRIKKETNEKCPDCNGSGKNPYFKDDNCPFCNGTGKNYILDWNSAKAISASFTLFSEMLYYCHKIDTSTIEPQLLTIITETGKSIHGGSMHGEISIPLTEWLNSLGNHAEIPKVIQVMRTTYNQMVGLQDYYEHSFQFRIRNNGKFSLDIPGDSCGIDPSDSYTKTGEGWKFACHNMDNSLQQICAIAGLASLCDEFRYR